MDSIHSEYVKADNLLRNFASNNQKFENRYTAILKDINEFIKALDIQDKVKVNELCLGYCLVDYFEDIGRLKHFHKVEHVNSIKIVAYTSYWILNRKPIQVIEQDKDLLYVNEQFVLAYILDFLSDREEKKEHILERTNTGLNSFSELLFYFLKYRMVSANSLELVITSFLAGRIYQEDNEDISSKLGKYV